MVEALTDAHLGLSLVGNCAKREGQSWEPFVHFDEESSRTFHLQVVDLLKLTLEDGAAGLVLTRLTLTGADEDVEADYVTWSELELGDVVTWRGSVDDHIISVDYVSLDFVREDAFDRVALELLRHRLNHFSDFSVRGGLANFALGSLEGIPGGQDDVCLAAIDGTIANHNSRCRVGGVAVEVGTADAVQRV